MFHSNVAASLLADGSNLASKLSAKFQTTSPHFQQQGKTFGLVLWHAKHIYIVKIVHLSKFVRMSILFHFITKQIKGLL